MAVPGGGLGDVRRRARRNAIRHQVTVSAGSAMSVMLLVVTLAAGVTFFGNAGGQITDTAQYSATPGQAADEALAPPPPTAGGGGEGVTVSPGPTALPGGDVARQYVNGLGFYIVVISVPLLLLAGLVAVVITARSDVPQRRLPTPARVIMLLAFLIPAVMLAISALTAD